MYRARRSGWAEFRTGSIPAIGARSPANIFCSAPADFSNLSSLSGSAEAPGAGPSAHSASTGSTAARTAVLNACQACCWSGAGDMLANIAAMQDMLAGTLSFAAGATSSDASEAFDLASMLISLSDEATDAGGAAEYAGPNRATLSGRRTAICRVFANLIQNAERYGGLARVALSKAP